MCFGLLVWVHVPFVYSSGSGAQPLSMPVTHSCRFHPRLRGALETSPALLAVHRRLRGEYRQGTGCLVILS